MVGLAESASSKTLVRSHTGIRGAFVVETAADGKSGVAVQLEGSCFETVWQLEEGGVGGILDLNKVREQIKSHLLPYRPVRFHIGPLVPASVESCHYSYFLLPSCRQKVFDDTVTRGYS